MRSPNRQHDVPLLSKYSSMSTARVILESTTLRWSSPVLFNDPFDVAREFEVDFSFEDIRKAIVARFRDYIDGSAEPKTQWSQLIVGEIRKRGKRREGRELATLEDSLMLMAVPALTSIAGMRRIWEERIPGMRILCFSAVADSPKMWAHYAGNHSGVVLQFESSDERDSSWLLAQPVIYRSEKPSLPGVEEWVRSFLSECEIDWDEYLREYYYVKSPEWTYEQEYRVVSDRRRDESGLYSDYGFHPEDLRRVIVGVNADPANTRRIVEFARGYPNAEVRRAQIDHHARRIGLAPSAP